MYYIICALTILLLSSCSTSNNHPRGNNQHKHHKHHHHNHEKLNHPKVISLNHFDKGNHVLIIIKHKPQLSKYERKQIRKWCHKHYHHHKKSIKFKFVVVK